MDVAHLQAGHSTAVAEHNYTRRPSELRSIASLTSATYELLSFKFYVYWGLAQNNSFVSAQAFPLPLINKILYRSPLPFKL